MSSHGRETVATDGATAAPAVSPLPTSRAPVTNLSWLARSKGLSANSVHQIHLGLFVTVSVGG